MKSAENLHFENGNSTLNLYLFKLIDDGKIDDIKGLDLNSNLIPGLYIMDKSLQTSIIFQTYSVILNLLNKSLLLLAEKGADKKTLSFMVDTINVLIQKVNDYASNLAYEKKWNDDLDEICNRYKIARAKPNKEDT